MFIGSGMPRNLWKRVAERFPDAKILEFYASAEGEAILANLTGQKPGSMGRPLPGTAEVRVAAFDLATRELQLTAEGLGRECLADEIGLLLTRVGPGDANSGVIRRGVFATGDAWRSTGDLFLRDDQGDHWLAGSVAEIVETARGPVLPAGARFGLGNIPAVDLLVAYGVKDGDERRARRRGHPARGHRAQHRRSGRRDGPAAAPATSALRPDRAVHPADHVAPPDLAQSAETGRTEAGARPTSLANRRPTGHYHHARRRLGPP